MHRHALATKTLPPKLAEVLQIVVECVIRWLSRGKVRVELAFENYDFILILAYMANIFDALNHINRQMQGGGFNIIEAKENLKAFF